MQVHVVDTNTHMSFPLDTADRHLPTTKGDFAVEISTHDGLEGDEVVFAAWSYARDAVDDVKHARHVAEREGTDVISALITLVPGKTPTRYSWS